MAPALLMSNEHIDRQASRECQGQKKSPRVNDNELHQMTYSNLFLPADSTHSDAPVRKRQGDALPASGLHKQCQSYAGADTLRHVVCRRRFAPRTSTTLTYHLIK